MKRKEHVKTTIYTPSGEALEEITPVIPRSQAYSLHNCGEKSSICLNQSICSTLLWQP